ncbi:AAA family ATPase [Fundidesulfovibrio soli]|uniref:AAA family ATPase n=1 Tax=Fundidesulfovibrio soli TaxID=2922716 RepID=UPI001FAFAB2A|nr:ATP-binding protein [Fundidesulfovibrio soli]
MSDSFERQRLLRMVWNLIRRMNWTHHTALEIISWVEEHQEALRVPAQVQSMLASKMEMPMKQLWERLKAYFERRVTGRKAARPGVTEMHIQRVGLLFGLDELEMEILGLALAYRNEDAAEALVDAATERRQCGPGVVAVFLGVRQDEVLRRLQKKSRLVATGLLDVEFGFRQFRDVFTVSDNLLKAIAPPLKKPDDLREMLLGVPAPAELTWEDFQHLGQQCDLLAKLLAGAAKSGEPGVNILVYGPPGTGKTELCKTVAAHLGMAIYPVGESDDTGGEPCRRERLQNMRMTQMLLANQPEALVLFDEMEDVFDRSPHQERFSRVFVHRLLETNTRPILWTCNHIDSFDAAILRRMSMAIEVRSPGPKVRQRVWTRVLSRHRIELPEDKVRMLGREFDSPPALADNAARAAHLAGGGWDEVRMLVRGMNKVLTGRDRSTSAVEDFRFDPDLASADVNLRELAERLAQAGSRRFSLCLSGPPGTGKSAFAGGLAEQLGMPVIRRRASDLLSMWVGESEKSIAGAFAQAACEEAMLVFDEADSLLSERSTARQSWEVSQVNEMLTWMESHPLPFVCTTNLMDRLDQASLRRFVFKVEFSYLPVERLPQAFSRFFGLDAPAGSLGGFDRLTPGDFALVARKAAILGKGSDPAWHVEMLGKEMLAKPGGKGKAMGF